MLGSSPKNWKTPNHSTQNTQVQPCWSSSPLQEYNPCTTLLFRTESSLNTSTTTASAEFAMLCIIKSLPQACEVIDKGFLSTSAVEEKRQLTEQCRFPAGVSVPVSMSSQPSLIHTIHSEQDV